MEDFLLTALAYILVGSACFCLVTWMLIIPIVDFITILMKAMTWLICKISGHPLPPD